MWKKVEGEPRKKKVGRNYDESSGKAKIEEQATEIAHLER